MPTFSEKANKEVGLPLQTFFYTLDQISTMLNIKPERLREMTWFDRRMPGFPRRDFLLAHNMAPPDQVPEWRIADRELIRFLRVKGYKVVERGYARS
jgi:hypothetical protein